MKEARRAANDNKVGISLFDIEIRTSIGDSILSSSTSFVLVKDITNLVILGTLFIEELIPLMVTNQGIQLETILFPYLLINLLSRKSFVPCNTRRPKSILKNIIFLARYSLSRIFD